MTKNEVNLVGIAIETNYSRLHLTIFFVSRPQK